MMLAIKEKERLWVCREYKILCRNVSVAVSWFVSLAIWKTIINSQRITIIKDKTSDVKTGKIKEYHRHLRSLYKLYTEISLYTLLPALLHDSDWLLLYNVSENLTNSQDTKHIVTAIMTPAWSYRIRYVSTLTKYTRSQNTNFTWLSKSRCESLSENICLWILSQVIPNKDTTGTINANNR